MILRSIALRPPSGSTPILIVSLIVKITQKSLLPLMCSIGPSDQFLKFCKDNIPGQKCDIFDVESAHQAAQAFTYIAFGLLTVSLFGASYIQGKFCPSMNCKLSVVLELCVALCWMIALGVYDSAIFGNEFVFTSGGTVFSIHAGLGFIS